MRLALACPTYGCVQARAAQGLRLAIMTASNRGITWAGDYDITGAKLSTIDSVRNRMVRTAIKAAEMDPLDGILWCDSDIRPPADGIARLVSHGFDFVTGMYRHKVADGSPLVGILVEELRQGKGAISWMEEWPENTVAPVDACGFGFVYTSMNMLRMMGDPWFAFGDWSEDFTFCLKAKAAGYQLYVDTGVWCSHLGEPHEWTIEEYQQRRAAGRTVDDPMPAHALALQE